METIKKFVGDYGWKLYPQQSGEYIIATDAHILIRKKGTIKETPLEKLSESNIAYIDTLFNIENKEPNTVLSKDVKEILDPLRKVKKYDEESSECAECNGLGYVDWEFGIHTKEDDCPVCDGYGEVIERKEFSGYGFKNYDCVTMYDDFHLRADLFYKIIDAFEEVTFYNSNHTQLYFTSGDYDGVIMRYTNGSSSSIADFSKTKTL